MILLHEVQACSVTLRVPLLLRWLQFSTMQVSNGC